MLINSKLRLSQLGHDARDLDDLFAHIKSQVDLNINSLRFAYVQKLLVHKDGAARPAVVLLCDDPSVFYYLRPDDRLEILESQLIPSTIPLHIDNYPRPTCLAPGAILHSFDETLARSQMGILGPILQEKRTGKVIALTSAHIYKEPEEISEPGKKGLVISKLRRPSVEERTQASHPKIFLLGNIPSVRLEMRTGRRWLIGSSSHLEIGKSIFCNIGISNGYIYDLTVLDVSNSPFLTDASYGTAYIYDPYCYDVGNEHKLNLQIGSVQGLRKQPIMTLKNSLRTDSIGETCSEYNVGYMYFRGLSRPANCFSVARRPLFDRFIAAKGDSGMPVVAIENNTQIGYMFALDATCNLSFFVTIDTALSALNSSVDAYAAI